MSLVWNKSIPSRTENFQSLESIFASRSRTNGVSSLLSAPFHALLRHDSFPEPLPVSSQTRQSSLLTLLSPVPALSASAASLPLSCKHPTPYFSAPVLSILASSQPPSVTLILNRPLSLPFRHHRTAAPLFGSPSCHYFFSSHACPPAISFSYAAAPPFPHLFLPPVPRHFQSSHCFLCVDLQTLLFLHCCFSTAPNIPCYASSTHPFQPHACFLELLVNHDEVPPLPRLFLSLPPRRSQSFHYTVVLPLADQRADHFSTDEILLPLLAPALFPLFRCVLRAAKRSSAPTLMCRISRRQF